MFELDAKLQELIKWVKDTYGVNTTEAINSITKKLECIL